MAEKVRKPKPIHVGDVQPTVNYVDGKFRLHSVSCFEGIDDETHDIYFSTRPVSYGLGIECKSGEKNYLVIATIHPDKDGNCGYTTVGTRVEEYVQNWDDVQTFRSLVYKGCNLVSRAFLRQKGELDGTDADDLELLDLEGVEYHNA